MDKNKKIKEIIIIHEYGEPSHYTGLIHFAKDNNINVEFRDFNFPKKALISFRRKNYKGIAKACSDFLWFLSVLINPNILRKKYCVVGIAPFDFMIVPLRRILSKCNYAYHTSWLYWDGKDVPKKNIYFKNKIEKGWRSFLKDASMIATVTHNAKENINQYFPETLRKTKVVFHAFNENIFNCKKLKRSHFKIIYVGRIEKYKGIEKIVDMAKLRPDIEFTFIGNGAGTKFIESMAEQFININYIGYITEKEKIAHYLNESDVLLLPSLKINGWEELFGIALIEAMACGCIPIVTNHQGPATILKDTVFEPFLLNEQTFVEDAVNIVDGLKNDNEKEKLMSSAAIDIAQKYNLKNISKIWEMVINHE